MCELDFFTRLRFYCLCVSRLSATCRQQMGVALDGDCSVCSVCTPGASGCAVLQGLADPDRCFSFCARSLWLSVESTIVVSCPQFACILSKGPGFGVVCPSSRWQTSCFYAGFCEVFARVYRRLVVGSIRRRSVAYRELLPTVLAY